MNRNETRRVSIVSCALLAVVLASVPTMRASAANAGAVACGDTILENVTLDSDLICAGSGLIVGADGVRVNLNGHTISGSGVGNGIDLAGRAGVTVVGGTIRGFFTGIRGLNTTDADIKANRLEGNVDGVDLQAGCDRVVVKDNDFVNNTSRGIMLRGGTTGIEVKANTFANQRVGVLLFGTTGAVVKANTITASTVAAINLNFQTSGNVVLDNVVASSLVGIQFVAGPSGGSPGNTFRANLITANTCGLRGPYTDSTFVDNTFAGNTTDICAT